MIGSANPKISALLWMPHGREIQGGHQVQLTRSAAALQRLGVEASVSLEEHPGLEGWSVIHGFGLSAEEVHRGRQAGSAVVLSTIYWDRSYRLTWGTKPGLVVDLRRRGRQTLRFAVAAARGPLSVAATASSFLAQDIKQIAAYEAADLLLPNSAGEAQSIARDLGIATPCHVVPNGVDSSRIEVSERPLSSRNDVLCVGRIEPHKNQLGLIEALRGTGLRLAIAGHIHPHHAEYARSCYRAGEGWVEFFPDAPDVDQHFASARVHVLASWFETTGLVSLEAAMAGCNIVSTSRGHAREYLEEDAWYCDPEDPPSIRRAVLSAWDAPFRPALRERILAKYTWDHAGAATLAAYRAVT